ncbi:colicin uptake membrane protein [Bifidobacterium pullorum]|uniref:Colicin uptake membrane protein n=1 Tax=Bifidobacterium pullorum TaxID=78448 RepID=A0A7V8HQV1_9BIFI|nr:colicin uptake membrane protein [Bifidobacterium pullorum]
MSMEDDQETTTPAEAPEESVSDADAGIVDEDGKTVPDTDDENENGTPDGSDRKRNIIIAASVAAVLLLAAGAGGYAYASDNVDKGMQSAYAQATGIDKQLADKLKEAQTLLDDTGKEQVADETTLDKLADSIKTAGKRQGVDKPDANRWLVWQTLGTQSAYDSDTEDAQAVIESLDKTMDAVNDSINDKQLTDAKAKLDQLVADAQKLYDSTDGKVQDNATRDALKTALDNAKKGDATSVDALDKLTAALNDAQTKVDDSVKAKEQADAEAQAQAEAAAAAANAITSTGSGYTGGGYTGGGYASGSTGSAGGGNTGGTGQSVTDTGGQWFGGNSVNGIYGYDSIGNPITPLEGNGWSQQIF